MAIGLPPNQKKTAVPVKPAVKPDEKKIQETINKGGSTTRRGDPSGDEAVYKNVNVKVLQSELETINNLRTKRPKYRDQKRLAVSLHNWIIEAIQEKIESEKRKYKL